VATTEIIQFNAFKEVWNIPFGGTNDPASPPLRQKKEDALGSEFLLPTELLLSRKMPPPSRSSTPSPAIYHEEFLMPTETPSSKGALSWLDWAKGFRAAALAGSISSVVAASSPINNAQRCFTPPPDVVGKNAGAYSDARACGLGEDSQARKYGGDECGDAGRALFRRRLRNLLEQVK
jgi:hypothetical protein